ncbi:MAG: DoxX family protein [bacterium]|nr:DoxX family protein [bacterium]
MSKITTTLNRIKDFAACKKDIILLLLRITIGIIFIQAGWGKLTNLDRTALFFGSIGIPAPFLNAVLASTAEFVGGIALLIGFHARLACLPLAFTMLIAIITAKLGDVSGFSDFIRLQELDYLLFFLLIAGIGAGKYSVDAKLGTDE